MSLNFSHILFLFLALLCSVGLLGQTAYSETPDISPSGVVQVESALLNEHRGDGYSYHFLHTIRKGLNQNLELRISFDLFRDKETIQHDFVTGFSPFLLGVKQQVYQSSHHQLTLLGQWQFGYTLENFFNRDQMGYDLHLVTNTNFSKSSLGFNIGMSRRFKADTRLLLASMYTYQLNDNLSIYGEVFSDPSISNPSDSYELRIGAGFGYQLSNELQVETHFSKPLQTPNNYLIGGGVNLIL